MNKLDLAFPDSTKSIIDQPTCSLTTPNSLLTGCLDGIKDTSTNPGGIGAAGIGVGLAAGIGVGLAAGIGVGLAAGIGVGLAAGIGVGLAAGSAALKNNSVIGAVGEVLGVETLGACAYGAINTAVDNCKATDPSNSIQITPTITPTITPITDATSNLLGDIGELN